MRNNQARWVTLAIISFAGTIFSVLLFLAIYKIEQSRIKVLFDEASVYRFRYIEDAVGDAIQALSSFGSFYASSQNVEEDEFDVFSQGIFKQFPYISEFCWLQRVKAADKQQEEHFPNTYISLNPYSVQQGHRVEPLYGLDAASFPERLKAIRSACDSGLPEGTGEIRHFGGQDMLYASRIYLPVYRNNLPHETIEERRNNLSGFVALIYRVDGLVEKSLNKIPSVGVDVAIYNISSGEKELIYSHPSEPGVTGNHSKLSWSGILDVAGQKWLITCTPTPFFLKENKIILPWAVLILGLILTLAITGYLQSILSKAKKIELLVDRRTREWQETFDAISDFVFIINKDNRILKSNRAFRDAVKLKEEEVVGKFCYEIAHKRNSPWPNCPHQMTVRDKKAHTEIVDDPVLGLPLLITTSPIFNERSEFMGSVHIARDITAIKRLDKMKDEFISTVSHELRTPLAIMREALSQILEGMHGAVTERQAHFLEVSRLGIDRITRIVENLLDISKIESGRVVLKYEPVNIVAVARNVGESMDAACRNKGLSLEYQFARDNIEAVVDRDRVTEVFINLINNATKFTNSGYIKVSVTDKDDAVECAVADTGIGISESDVPKLFNKFEQLGRTNESERKGIGLGLAISKGIIELHKGRIWVESKPGEGSTFKFTLPKHPSKTEVSV